MYETGDKQCSAMDREPISFLSKNQIVRIGSNRACLTSQQRRVVYSLVAHFGAGDVVRAGIELRAAKVIASEILDLKYLVVQGMLISQWQDARPIRTL
jgi:hypothetical protein